jgi:hypothetical protein
MGSNDGNQSRYAIFFFISSLSNESLSIFFYSVIFSILLTYQSNLDRLDGLYHRRSSSSISSSPPLEKRLNNTTINIDEQSNDLSPNLQSKKKKVRWADIEENVLHLHKKAGRDFQNVFFFFSNFLTFFLFSWFCCWSN